MFEIKEFKGKPVAQIKEEGMLFPFTFGLKKAELMLKYLDNIQSFVREKGAAL